MNLLASQLEPRMATTDDARQLFVVIHRGKTSIRNVSGDKENQENELEKSIEEEVTQKDTDR